eukprot:TRINITY_DN13137_c0_g1_i1.p1 TRINITY_DN13137_c0_g1~~TRINITY_DN13137_c0_g1_i1.p1  ORF type:complete len:164 (-),score=30.11 TRINITY_DN13137_c0_g1_i1:204-668(-)
MASRVGGELHSVAKRLATQNAKKVRVKKTNIFDLVFQHRDYGVGKKFSRSIWPYPNTYWTITRVKPKVNEPFCKRGKAWGVLTWRGRPEETEREIRSPLKRQWREVRDDSVDAIDLSRYPAPVFEVIEDSVEVNDLSQHQVPEDTNTASQTTST